MTYKKINLSEIDFILTRADGTLIPISISEKDTVHTPKISASFMEMYGYRVKHRIKLCPTLLHHQQQDGYSLHCLPRCMAKFLYGIINS